MGTRLFQGSELVLTGTSALVHVTEDKPPEEFLGLALCIKDSSLLKDQSPDMSYNVEVTLG